MAAMTFRSDHGEKEMIHKCRETCKSRFLCYDKKALILFGERARSVKLPVKQVAI